MSAFVVLGCHRSGTSLVASLLQGLGVHIGDRLLGGSKLYNPRGHFEDRDFLDLNERILRACHGSWHMPPAHHAVMDEGRAFRREIKALVESKRRELWGWKDPRSCMTACLYYPYLQDPHWVVVHRSADEIRASLERRNKGIDAQAVVVSYLADMEWTLSHYPAPLIRLQFEKLVDKEQAPEEVARLADFVGVPLPENLLEERVIWR